MKNWIALVLVICLGGRLLNCQEEISYKQIDSATYALYNQAKWDSLLKVGKKALKDGVDYYYLRMRLGIANYEMQKYAFSTQHFQKALELNNRDLYARNYQYYSLLYMGKTAAAHRFTREFTDVQKEYLGMRNRPVSMINLYAGYIFSNNPEKNQKISLLTNEAVYGEQVLYGNQAHFQAGLCFQVSPTVSIYTGYSFMRTAKTNRYQYVLGRYRVASRTPLPGGGYQNNYELQSETHERTFDGQIGQSQLYLNSRLQFDGGFSFNLFTNLLFINLNTVDVNLTSFIQRDTLAYNAVEDTYLLVDLEEFDYTFSESDTSFVNWLTGFNIQKDFNFLITDLSGIYSKLYDRDHFQLGLSLTYYPLGNLNLYGVSGGIYLNSSNKGDEEEASSIAYYQLIGMKIMDKIWLEGSLYTGGLRYMNINQGSVVFNLPDRINYVTGLKLTILVGNHLWIDIMYDYISKSGSYFSIKEAESGFSQFFTTYQNQSITGGIKWYF